MTLAVDEEGRKKMNLEMSLNLNFEY